MVVPGIARTPGGLNLAGCRRRYAEEQTESPVETILGVRGRPQAGSGWCAPMKGRSKTAGMPARHRGSGGDLCRWEVRDPPAACAGPPVRRLGRPSD